MTDMKRYAIIVAGGSGKRMKSELPKQFLEINGKAILMHTLERFHQYERSVGLIAVLPKEHIPTWKKLCRNANFVIPHKIVEGGPERFFSVKNGLNEIKAKDAVVAIHDGVRPFVTTEKIGNSFKEAIRLSAVVLAVDLKDSIRCVQENTSKTVDRSLYKLVQTPQTFEIGVIKKAYQQEFSTSFTDDASVVEALGERVHLIEGDYDNIKITSPDDLIIGKAILQNQNQE